MIKIYKNQNKLRIILNAHVDITGSTPYIQYKKPDNTTGQWTGTIHDALVGKVRYDVVSITELNISGQWIIWIYNVFSDDRVAYGQPFKFTIYEVGT